MIERIVLRDVSASEPKIFEIDNRVLNIEGMIFEQGIVKNIVVENYGGLKQLVVYNSRERIAHYPMLNKNECIIETIVEDEAEVVAITVR